MLKLHVRISFRRLVLLAGRLGRTVWKMTWLAGPPRRCVRTGSWSSSLSSRECW